MAKLVDLHPRWIIEGLGKHRTGLGVSFDCPHCSSTRIHVFFAAPLDGGPPMPDVLLWNNQGTTFETLTLLPSIDQRGHYHGYLTNGELS
jgi:hypothetical protein